MPPGQHADGLISALWTPPGAMLDALDVAAGNAPGGAGPEQGRAARHRLAAPAGPGGADRSGLWLARVSALAETDTRAARAEGQRAIGLGAVPARLGPGATRRRRAAGATTVALRAVDSAVTAG